MDQDWDDYYHELEEYKAKTGIDPETKQNQSTDAASSSSSSGSDAADLASFFTGGTLAIDIGTARIKLSHRPSLSNNKNKSKGPEVSVDREGYRSTPALVWLPPLDDGNQDMLVGRLAKERSYDTKGGSIVHPRDVLLGQTNNNNDNIAAIQQILRTVASNALDQALGNSSSGKSNSGSGSLFVLDESISTLESFNVRPIFTYPNENYTDQYLQRYQEAVNGLTSPAGIADYVPEPLATVAAAEYYNLLPPKSASADSVLVIDVGGSATCVSLVSGSDEVLHSSSLHFGGDTFIDLLVSHLIKEFYGTIEEESSSVSSKPNLNDPVALQRLYEASTTAIHELSNKTRSEINIPYLTMDLETRQPKHLEVGMSRGVVESEADSWVKNKLVPHLIQKQSGSSNKLLSQSLPTPTNIESLFSSVIMSLLEETSHAPNLLRAILLVGGGARIPLVQAAVKDGFVKLAGDIYVNGGGGEPKKLIIPQGEMIEELSVLGGAIWGSSR